MLVKTIKRILSEYTWDLAYGDYCEQDLLNGIKWHKIHVIKNPYKKKWFADPFILSANDKEIELLVEEYDSQVKRGRIAHIRIEKKISKIVDFKIILDLDTHLSFPVIYRIDDKIYVHPENSASGRSSIYRYDLDLGKLVDPIDICDVPLVDAIIRKTDSGYKMYATRTPDTCGKVLDIYESDVFFGKYKFLKHVEFERKEARMAGGFISTSIGLVRPAQDCNFNYGEATLFYKDKTVISEIRPRLSMYEGTHTFNTDGKIFIIDLKKYDYPIVHQMIKKIVRIINNIRKK